MKIIPVLLAVSILVFSFPVVAKDPDCSSPNNWPSRMAFYELRDAKILVGETSDYNAPKVVRLASEKIGLVSEKTGEELYRQIHLLTFVLKSGKTVSVITVSNSSRVECSMSGVDVYVISKHLGAAQEKQ